MEVVTNPSIKNKRDDLPLKCQLKKAARLFS